METESITTRRQYCIIQRWQKKNLTEYLYIKILLLSMFASIQIIRVIRCNVIIKLIYNMYIYIYLINVVFFMWLSLACTFKGRPYRWQLYSCFFDNNTRVAAIFWSQHICFLISNNAFALSTRLPYCVKLKQKSASHETLFKT